LDRVGKDSVQVQVFCHKQEDKNYFWTFSLADHLAFSSVYSIFIPDTLIKPFNTIPNQKRAMEKSKDQKFQITITHYLGNNSIISSITTTYLHFKITLINENIYDNNKEWL